MKDIEKTTRIYLHNIAIYGDSFANTEWTTNTYEAWPELLAEHYAVTNYSEEGCSLWKSYDQLKRNHKKYDYNIFVGTIYSRIYMHELDVNLTVSQKSWPVEDGINLGYTYYKHFSHPIRDYQMCMLMVKDLMQLDNVLYIPAFAESVFDLNLMPLNRFFSLELEYYNIVRFDKEFRKCHLSKESNLVVFHAIMQALKTESKTLTISESDFVKPADPLEYYFG